MIVSDWDISPEQEVEFILTLMQWHIKYTKCPSNIKIYGINNYGGII